MTRVNCIPSMKYCLADEDAIGEVDEEAMEEEEGERSTLK